MESPLADEVVLNGVNASGMSDNLPRESDGDAGLGVHAAYAPGVGPAPEVSITASRFEGNHLVGVLALDSILDVERTAVCGTIANGIYRDARGIGLERYEADAPRGRARIESSLLCENYGHGIYSSDTDLEVVTSEIRATRPGLDGQFGFGLTLVDGALTEVSGVSVSDSRLAGIVLLHSEAILDGVAVRDTLARESDGAFGDGIAVLVQDQPASASIQATLVQNSARAAVSSFGGDVTLANSRLDCYLIPLDGEQTTRPFSFEDLGDNWCGCGDVTETCAVRSSNLQPPEPPEFEPP